MLGVKVSLQRVPAHAPPLETGRPLETGLAIAGRFNHVMQVKGCSYTGSRKV